MCLICKQKYSYNAILHLNPLMGKSNHVDGIREPAAGVSRCLKQDENPP